MPAAGAAAVLFDSRGRVLLVREGYRRRRWSMPGGEIEIGEQPHEAAVREAREETGLVVTPTAVLGLYRFHGDHVFDVYAYSATTRARRRSRPRRRSPISPGPTPVRSRRP